MGQMYFYDACQYGQILKLSFAGKAESVVVVGEKLSALVSYNHPATIIAYGEVAYLGCCKTDNILFKFTSQSSLGTPVGIPNFYCSHSNYEIGNCLTMDANYLFIASGNGPMYRMDKQLLYLCPSSSHG